ncbi:PPE family protein [Mycobacterium sp.]|uniref:PPE family protein n=1 Tax=Mycobacterium sp. TaxID=1785 RepID=UPI0031DB83CB
MGFDFASWPPELIAALIKAGAGSAPMMSAATSWHGLAAELEQAATSYQSVISELGSTWHGPSSTSMASAASQYIEWLQQTAMEAQQAGSQALSSAAAYETASNTIVPLPVIEANRAQLQALVATNFLGVNTPAILATEAAYAAMWATNSAVMHAYSAASSAAAQLMPMSPAPQTTNPAGSLAQAAAAPGNAASSSAQSGLNGLGSIGQLASSAASTSGANSALSTFSQFDSFLGANPFLEQVINQTVYSMGWYFPMMGAVIPSLAHTLASAPLAAVASDVAAPEALGAGLLVGGVSPASVGGSLGGTTGVLASVGGSSAVGGMAVPAGWAGAAPDVNETATLTGNGWAGEPEMGGGGVNAVPAGMPAAAPGRGGYGFGAPRYGVKPRVMPKQVFA